MPRLGEQPWTPAVTLLQGCDGLRAWRMAVLRTFRVRALGRHVRRAFLRNALPDFTPILPATACHQISYVETYSRYTVTLRYFNRVASAVYFNHTG